MYFLDLGVKGLTYYFFAWMGTLVEALDVMKNLSFRL